MNIKYRAINDFTLMQIIPDYRKISHQKSKFCE